MSERTAYSQTADRLVERIEALGPRILRIRDPFKLLRVPGFDCSDLQPSLFQASWALAKAQARLRAKQPTEDQP